MTELRFVVIYYQLYSTRYKFYAIFFLKHPSVSYSTTSCEILFMSVKHLFTLWKAIQIFFWYETKLSLNLFWICKLYRLLTWIRARDGVIAPRQSFGNRRSQRQFELRLRRGLCHNGPKNPKGSIHVDSGRMCLQSS